MNRNKNNQAMILAAGVGSRLDPLTSQLPKPLCPILGKPVMEHIVELCKKHGFTNLAANTNVMADKITNYFKDLDKRLGVNFNFVHEKELTGVGGGIRSCKNFLTEDVILIIMGDALTDCDLTALYEAHIKSNCEVTIGMRQIPDTSQFGVIVTDKNNRVISFQEKPKLEEAKSNFANTGIYFFNQRILQEFPSKEEFPQYDIAKHLFPKLMEKGLPIQALDIKTYWADIGTLQQYHDSIKDVLESKVKINIDAEVTTFGYKEKGVLIDPSAKIKGKVYLGRNVKIGPNVTLNGPVYIEENCSIEADTYISNSIIWPNSLIGKNVKVINSILGNKCRVNESTEIISNSVWAPETLIKSDSKPSVVLK